MTKAAEQRAAKAARLIAKANEAHDLSRSDYRYDRINAAKSPYCRVEDLLWLIRKEKDYTVRLTAWANMNLPYSIVRNEITEIVAHPRRKTNGATIYGILQRTDVTVEDLLSINVPAIVAHPNYPESLILEYLQIPAMTTKERKARCSMQVFAAGRANLSDELQCELAASPHKEVRGVLTSRCHTLCVRVIEMMLQDTQPHVLFQLTNSPASLPYHQQIADRIRLLDSSARQWVAMDTFLVQHATRKEDVEAAVKHQSPTVVRAALASPLMTVEETTETLASFALGRSKKRRKLAFTHDGTPEEYKVAAYLLGVD